MHVVLIETSGNQNYIFATNKLRENVGASELTYRVGTQFVLRAVREFTGKTIHDDEDSAGKRTHDIRTLSGKTLRTNLTNKNLNPEIGPDTKVEVITATSGKALLVVWDEETAKEIVRDVTRRALKEMPGLTIHGAISNPFDDLSCIHKGIGEVHRKLERLRHEMPGNEQRVQRLPFVAPCSTSGLPAQKVRKYEQQERAYSDTVCAKSDNKDYAQERIEAVLSGLKLIDPLKIEKCEWTAVIHADGNGLGAVFLEFDKLFRKTPDIPIDGRRYIDDYRRFSIALDRCTIRATRTALQNLWNHLIKEDARSKNSAPGDLSEEDRNKIELPFVPLVLGGDDLTVLCDGQYALKFTHDFLTEFEQETKKVDGESGDIISKVAHKFFGTDYLGISAGVAIVKPHFPFHQAYELAESLIKSAKLVKEKLKHRHPDSGDIVDLPASALDFHILYDSAYSSLERIRQKLRPDADGKLKLFAKPYVVTGKSDIQKAIDGSWVLGRREFDLLANRVAAMLAREDDDNSKRKLPNSQLHDLREALFFGKQESDARTGLIAHRYRDKGFNELIPDLHSEGTSLFFADDGGYSTHFMDALDAVDFWHGFNGKGEAAS